MQIDTESPSKTNSLVASPEFKRGQIQNQPVFADSQIKVKDFS